MLFGVARNSRPETQGVAFAPRLFMALDGGWPRQYRHNTSHTLPHHPGCGRELGDPVMLLLTQMEWQEVKRVVSTQS